MSRLQWTFDLLDRVSAPARRINQALRGTDAALKKVVRGGEAAQKALQRSFGLSERAARGLTGAIATIGAAQGSIGALHARVGALRGAFSGVAGSVLNLKNALIAGAIGFATKSVVDQVGFIEQQRIALGTILGSPLRANAALDWAIKFADVTPFETPQVLEAVRQALAVGFNTRQIEPLLTTLGDTAAALSLGSTGLNDLITVFGQIRSAGKLNTEEVNQLTERGIPAFEILAKAFNTDIPTVRKLIEQGQISSEAALGAIHRGLKGRFGGGMAAQARSIFGLISTLRSRPQTLAFRLEQDKALEPFRQVLVNLADLTDFNKPPGSTIGARLTKGISGLFKAAFGPLAAATEPKQAGEAILGFLNRATTVVEQARATWPQVRAIALDFFAGVRSGFDLLTGLWRRVEPLATALGRLSGSFGQTEAGMGGTIAGTLRLLGTIAALAAAWRVLNLVSLGGVGALTRWGTVATVAATRGLIRLIGMGGQALLARGRVIALQRALTWLGGRVFTAIARVSVLGFSAIWTGIRALALLGVTAIRTSGMALLAGLRMAGAWLLAAGPIGWLIGGIALVGGALVLAYKRVGWFRDMVTRAWQGLKQAGKGLLDWFTSLPERIGNTFARLPGLLQGLLRRAIDLLPPGVRDVVKGLVGGLLGGDTPVENAATQLADKVQQGFSRPLEIRSPSRRFAYLGRMLGAGLEGGMRSSLAQVQRAAAGLAVAATLSLPQPVASPSFAYNAPNTSRIVNVTVGPITVNGGAEAKAVAEEVRMVALEAVLEALERAAREEGA
ncbi:MAG: tape measure protein [Meiothermus ruber]|nr:tape measure protein [Meiothermus ruber]